MQWGEVCTGIVDLADKYRANPDGGFVIQTEVRMLFHNVEGEAKIC
jgi:hypothetical protein